MGAQAFSSVALAGVTRIGFYRHGGKRNEGNAFAPLAFQLHPIFSQNGNELAAMTPCLGRGWGNWGVGLGMWVHLLSLNVILVNFEIENYF